MIALLRSMIACAATWLRRALEWRRWRHLDRYREATRAAESRRRAAGFLARHAEHAATARALFADAAGAGDYNTRMATYCRAIAAENRAEACLRLAGSNSDETCASAAALIRDAEAWDARGGAPRSIASQPPEAAHA